MAAGGGKKGGSKKAPAAKKVPAAKKATRPSSSKSSRSRTRKPAASKKKAASAAAAGGAVSPTLAAAAAVVLPAPTGPTPTLILDTGGWTVKHGLVTVTPPPPPPAAWAGGEAGTIAAAVPPIATASCSAAIWSQPHQAQSHPRQSPNATARPHHQLTVLAADEIRSVRNQSQLVVTRPLERGYATDLGSQLRVWKRICDAEGVDAVPSSAGGPLDTAVANVLGLGPAAAAAKKKKKKRASAGAAGAGASVPALALSPPPPTCASRDCAVLVLTQPFTPRTVSDRIDEVWFRDLGFARVGRRLVQGMAAHRYLSGLTRKRRRAEEEHSPSVTAAAMGRAAAGAEGAATDASDAGDTDAPPWDDDRTECCLVIDSGFSLTHVVPTVSARAVARAVRRLNVGGKFLTNLLKEAVSYRQWNMMDEFHIVNEAKEALCYVSNDFDIEMKGAAALKPGWRDFDRDFVLPDFSESFEGTVRLPAPLARMKAEEEASRQAEEEAKVAAAAKKEKKAKGSEGDVGVGASEENGTIKEEDGSDDGNGEGKDDAEEEANADSDDETGEQRRKRILRQREEEHRRLEAEEAERQVLSLSVERFAVPEALFRPTDVGLEQGGIAETVVQAVEACDPYLRAAMLQNIVVVGGNARMPGFGARLEKEVRRLAPCGYKVQLWTPADPVGYAWRGAREFAASAEEDAFRTCSIDRVEWEASRRSGAKGEQLNVWAKLEEKHTADGMIIM